MTEPRQWRSLARAAEIVLQAVKKGEVLVWGHDDLDGIASTAIMLRALEGSNARASYHIPARGSIHYGLDPDVIRTLPGRGTALLLTVDCGITNREEARLAKDLGLAVVVTDHHEPPACLPGADAVVNPKLDDQPRPSPELAGCGVALYLAGCLAGRSGTGWMGRDSQSLAWAALGTVSDRVPLVGENREIVKEGLPALAADPILRRAGEIAGLDVGAGLSPTIIRRKLVPILAYAESEGFRHGTVELLRGNVGPEELAVTRGLLACRDRELEAQFQRLLDEADVTRPYIIAIDETLNPDLLGPLASKLRDRTGKPAVVVSAKGGLLAGECRGFLPFDFVEFLGSMPGVFLQHGGHKQAAGFTVAAGQESRFKRLAVERLEERRGLMSDLLGVQSPEYSFNRLEQAGELARELAHRAPFGPGNPMPTAAFREIRVPTGPSPDGYWLYSRLLSTQDSGAQAGPLDVHIDITHTGEMLLIARGDFESNHG